MVNVLIRAGVNIDSTSYCTSPLYTDKDWFTGPRLEFDGPPSFFAVVNGLVDVLERLLSLGANVNFANFEKMTALMYAYWAPPSVRGAVISVLLKYGADVNARDRYGRSALFYLLFSEHAESITESAKLLLNAGAEMNILCVCRADPGKSLLWYACWKI